MTPGGYFGRALVVDVGSGEADRLDLPEPVLRGCIGGAGLGTWLMHRLAPPEVDPLGPDAPLAFVFSPLVGTPLTTSAKFAVVAKSPLTGLLNDALASSHFAIQGKLTGNDAIVVRGACEEPSVLLVEGEGARMEPADDLWGLSSAAAEAAAQDLLGELETLGVAAAHVDHQRPAEVAAGAHRAMTPRLSSRSAARRRAPSWKCGSGPSESRAGWMPRTDDASSTSSAAATRASDSLSSRAGCSASTRARTVPGSWRPSSGGVTRLVPSTMNTFA